MTTATIFDGEQPIISRRLTLKLVGANTSIQLPAGGSLRRVVAANRTPNAVTGGIRVGTSAGGAQVLTGQALAGSGVFEANTLISGLALTNQTLYVEAVTAWNGAVIDITIEYVETNTQY